MRSLTVMLAWEVCCGRRLALVGLPLALLASAAGVHLIHPGAGAQSVLADIACFLLVMALLFAFGIFNFTQLDRRTHQAGFPTRLFTLPVRTAALVTVPMLCGAIAVAALYVGWCVFVLRPLGRIIPLAWPALVLAVGMACYHAILWSLASMRVTRILALCTAGFILFIIALMPQMAVAFGRPPRTGTLGVTLSALGLLAYISALRTVDRQRHSAGHGSGLRFIIDALTNVIPARSRPFRTAAHAQFWYEMRRNGALLPAAVLLVMLVIPLPAFFVGRISAGTTILSFLWMCIGPLGLAAVVGKVFVRPDAWTFDLALPTFQSVRPILPSDYLNAKLKAAALSTLLAWTIVLTLGPLSLYCFHDTTRLWKAWKFWGAVFGPFLAPLSIGIVISLVLVSWKLMIKSVWMALRGPAWLYMTAVFAELIIAVTLIILLDDQFDSDHPNFVGVFLFRSLPLVAGLLAAAVVLKLFIALRAWHRGVAAGHTVTRHVGWTFFIWLSATLCVTATAFIFAWCFPLPYGFTAAGFLGLLSLPLARLAIAPSQLARNRHR